MTAEEIKPTVEALAERAKTLSKHIITMTAKAGSGHPTSSSSAVEVEASTGSLDQGLSPRI